MSILFDFFLQLSFHFFFLLINDSLSELNLFEELSRQRKFLRYFNTKTFRVVWLSAQFYFTLGLAAQGLFLIS